MIDYFGYQLPCAMCGKDWFDKVHYEIAFGKCGHYYHLECIHPFIEKYKKCPLCTEDWVDAFIVKDSNIINAQLLNVCGYV